jgi:large subunit ribosomal protein L6
MSRVGKQPIVIPAKTKVDVKGSVVTVQGPKGSLTQKVHTDMTVAVNGNEVLVTRPGDGKDHRSLHGLTRALVQNMVTGVNDGYTRELEIIGVGYRAELKGKFIQFNLGYSHVIHFLPPEGITMSYEQKENRVKISGIDKQLVGQVAAKIRSFRKPEPYKGKGVRYVGEQVRQKEGKTAGK